MGMAVGGSDGCGSGAAPATPPTVTQVTQTDVAQYDVTQAPPTGGSTDVSQTAKGGGATYDSAPVEGGGPTATDQFAAACHASQSAMPPPPPETQPIVGGLAGSGPPGIAMPHATSMTEALAQLQMEIGSQASRLQMLELTMQEDLARGSVNPASAGRIDQVKSNVAQLQQLHASLSAAGESMAADAPQVTSMLNELRLTGNLNPAVAAHLQGRAQSVGLTAPATAAGAPMPGIDGTMPVDAGAVAPAGGPSKGAY